MPLTAYLQLTASQLSNIQFYEFMTRDTKSRTDLIGPDWYIGEILMIRRTKEELPPKLHC